MGALACRRHQHDRDGHLRVIRRRYANGKFGQVHLRENDRIGGPPLVCLHATAYSSRSFERLLEALDGRRHCIALDTPGYGASDSPPKQIAIADYADALATSVAGEAGPVDLLGYHTGAYIAAEMAIRHPALVGRLVLIGIPFFQAIGFEQWKARLTARHALGEQLDQFDERWDFLVANRPDGLSLRRGFENFVDELSAWPNGWQAHEALFRWDSERQLPRVRQPVLVINPAGNLAEPSRAAAKLLPDATLVERPDLCGAVLETNAPAIAHEASAFLTEFAEATPSAA